MNTGASELQSYQRLLIVADAWLRHEPIEVTARIIRGSVTDVVKYRNEVLEHYRSRVSDAAVDVIATSLMRFDKIETMAYRAYDEKPSPQWLRLILDIDAERRKMLGITIDRSDEERAGLLDVLRQAQLQNKNHRTIESRAAVSVEDELLEYT